MRNEEMPEMPEMQCEFVAAGIGRTVCRYKQVMQEGGVEALMVACGGYAAAAAARAGGSGRCGGGGWMDGEPQAKKEYHVHRNGKRESLDDERR